MDTLESYRQIIRRILSEYARIAYPHGEIDRQTVFDSERDHYLLVKAGWDGDRRVYGCLVHVDIREEKIWIQYDGIEYGMANELVDAGVPKERIVLAFKPPYVRPYTEFAPA
jgi:hypothetical protein